MHVEAMKKRSFFHLGKEMMGLAPGKPRLDPSDSRMNRRGQAAELAPVRTSENAMAFTRFGPIFFRLLGRCGTNGFDRYRAWQWAVGQHNGPVGCPLHSQGSFSIARVE